MGMSTTKHVDAALLDESATFATPRATLPSSETGEATTRDLTRDPAHQRQREEESTPPGSDALDALINAVPVHRTRLARRIYHGMIDSIPAQAGVALLKRVLPPPHVELTHHEVIVPGLPRRLDGLRVLHISDLHLRPGSELADELPDVVAGVPHDLMLYTGDFIDDDDGIEPVRRVLQRMPRLAPAYAVLGNHDYWPLGRAHGRNDVTRLCQMLTDCGLEVLRNTARPVCGGDLYLVGVDDPPTKHDDVDRAMAAVPAGACTIMLVHTPDMVTHLGPHRPNLMLAGHTHGGQIRLPLVGPVITMSGLPRRKVMGLWRNDGRPVFVTRGIGYSGLNIRLGCPAEAAVLTLRTSH